jgi:hypothetical protein
MMTPATGQKRRQLRQFIQRVLASEPPVQDVVGIANGPDALVR